MARNDLPSWLHSRWVPAAGAVVAASVLAVALAFLAYEERELRKGAWTRAELYAQVLEDHANRTLGGLGVAMDAATENLTLHRDDHDGALQAALVQQSLQGLPFLRSLSLIAGDGRIIASSNPAIVGRVIDRKRLLPADQSAGLGPVLPVRDLGELATTPSADATATAHAALLPLVRPLKLGQAAGQTPLGEAWLVAALNPDYFANHYQRMLEATELKAAMLTYRGQLVAATSTIALAPGTVLSHTLFEQHLPDRERGRVEGKGLDGAPSILAYRSARQHPIALAVEMPEQAIAAQLNAVVRGVGAGVAAVLALLGALFALAWRSLHSHEAAQKDLGAARDTMAAQHAFTDRLFQLSPIPMVVKDTQGRFLRVNQAFTALTGLGPDAAIGHTMSALYPAHLAAPHDLQEQLALTSAQPATYEEQMLDRDGLPRDMMVRITPYTGADGRIAGVIGCLMDVSEFREAEARTLEAKDAAVRANAAKSEFLANISHELRTPLQTIIGFSELGTVRARSDPRVLGMFNDIHAAGQRMLALVNDLLDLSRLESTVGPVEHRPMDLLRPLQAVIDEMQPLAGPRGVRLRLTGTDARLAVLGDSFRLEQVLRNVLANAIRFSPQDGEVLVTCTSTNGHEHTVKVADQGPGIPPAELESIFEAFVQSSRTKSGAGGTGLGLAICRSIMQAHGGRIVADNRPEGGAVFSIVLPALALSPTESTTQV